METTYSPDQLESILHWLEYLDENGMTLKQVIEGLIDGSLTASTYGRSFSEQD